MTARRQSHRCRLLRSQMGEFATSILCQWIIRIVTFRNRSISFLYQQFEKEKEGDKKSNLPQKDIKPKTGYTIYVSGKTITEDFLKKHFSEFGTIVNVSMEIEKGRGFVTFSKTEATDRAIVDVSWCKNVFFLIIYKTFYLYRCTEKWSMEYNWQSLWLGSSRR